MSPRKRHHIRQGRPNRRFRRLVPAAVATAALAAGMPAVAPAATHHSRPPAAKVRPAGQPKAVTPASSRDAAGGAAVAAE